MSVEREDITVKLSNAWRRRVRPYISDGGKSHIFVIYQGEKLEGWISFHGEPTVHKYRDKPAVCVPVARWLLMRELAAGTVTPFYIVAQGRKLIQLAFRPHTGMKYPVMEVNGQPQVMFFVEDFKDLGAPNATHGSGQGGRADSSKASDDRRRE